MPFDFPLGPLFTVQSLFDEKALPLIRLTFGASQFEVDVTHHGSYFHVLVRSPHGTECSKGLQDCYHVVEFLLGERMKEDELRAHTDVERTPIHPVVDLSKEFILSNGFVEEFDVEVRLGCGSLHINVREEAVMVTPKDSLGIERRDWTLFVDKEGRDVMAGSMR